MIGSVIGLSLLALSVCACCLMAIRSRRALRRVDENEDRAFNLLVSDLQRTTRAIARTRFYVRGHFGC